MPSSAGSAPDPCALPYFFAPDPGGYATSDGKVRRDPRLNAGETTGVFVVAGQSNCANTVETNATLTNASKIDNLNIFDGGLYAAADPLVGCDGLLGNTFSRVADKLITAGIFARVILIPIGVGGSSAAQWADTSALGQRLIVAARRAAALGLTVSAYLWQQGEQDKTNGTSQSSYAASLAAAIALPRNAGFNAPWFIAKCSYINGAVSSAVQAAQVAAANGTTIFAGADTDSLTGTTTNRRPDDTHFKAAGADAAATLWKTAIDSVF